MNKKNNTKGKKGKKVKFGSTVPNQMYSQSFPREMKVTMKYFEIRSFTTTASIANDKMYNLNSIFDPDYSSTGHQPQGYDQWSSFYNRYRVDTCKVTVSIIEASADGLVATILGSNSTVAINDTSVAAESPLSITKTFTRTGPSVKLVKIFNLADLNGVTRTVYNSDDRYAAPFGSDPSEKLMLHTVVTNPALNAIVVNMSIQLEYYVTLFDPVQLSLS